MTALALLLLLLSTAILPARAEIPLPPPPANHHVRITSTELDDTSRSDPFSPSHDSRRLMVTSFTPLDCERTGSIPYMPDGVADANDKQFRALGVQNGAFESFRIETCAHRDSRSRRRLGLPLAAMSANNGGGGRGAYPLIIFSPGLATSRLAYSELLSAIASMGFVVVAVDHPYDANAVEYPSGEIVVGKNMTASTETKLLNLRTRVQDLSSVLGHLQSPSPSSNNPLLSRGLREKVNLAEPVVVGHSFGGATAAQIMDVDPRFAGGVNLDGILFGSVVGAGFKKPFFEMKSETVSSERDSSWDGFTRNLSGWKLQVLVEGTEHESFTDLPLLFDSLPNGKQVRRAAKEALGTLDGERIREIVAAYVSAAAKRFVDGQEPELLKGPSDRFPEVKHLNDG